MTRRTLSALLAVVLLTACSGGGDDVPEDQVVRPVDAPSGWTTTELETVTVATPPAWEEQPPQKQSDTLTSTAFRAPEVDGISPGGTEVRTISSPQQPADKAARSLALSAMASLGAGKVDPVEVTWPGAESAFFLEYEANVRVDPKDPTKTQPFPTATLVLDLADGSQVQVTALADGDADLARQTVSTTEVTVSAED